MTRDEVLEKLRALKPRFEELNIKRMALFGSYARDEATPDSDIDLLIKLGDRRPFTYFDIFDSRQAIIDFLGKDVDFVLNIHPLLKDKVSREKIDV
jgi:predicted nucleotidyltransferase